MPGFPTPIGLDQEQDQQYNGNRKISTGSVAIRFGPSKFSPLPSGKFTYSESLNKINWDDIFPTAEVLKPFIINEIKVKHYKITRNFNIFNSLLIPGYWVAAILYFIKAAVYFKNSNARNHIVDPWSILLADVGGFFIFPSLVILSNVCERLYKLMSAQKRYQKMLEPVLKDYKTRREVLLSTRNSMMQFFVLAEMFYGLLKNGLADFVKIRYTMSEFFKKQGLNNYGLNIEALDYIQLLALVRETFYDKRFKYIREKIIRAIKNDFMERQDYISNILLRELKLREMGKSGRLGHITTDQIVEVLTKLDTDLLIDYCNRVDECKFIQSIIFYYIGEVSSNKSEVNASILLRPIDIFEDGIDEVLKSAISDYWNNSSTVKLIHPHGLVVTRMGSIVNTQIIEQHLLLVSNIITATQSQRGTTNLFEQIHNMAQILFRPIVPVTIPPAFTPQGNILPLWYSQLPAVTPYQQLDLHPQDPMSDHIHHGM